MGAFSCMLVVSPIACNVVRRGNSCTRYIFCILSYLMRTLFPKKIPQTRTNTLCDTLVTQDQNCRLQLYHGKIAVSSCPIHMFHCSVHPPSTYRSQQVVFVAPCKGGQKETELYWQWVQEVKPPLPRNFRHNFHMAAILLKVNQSTPPSRESAKSSMVQVARDCCP